ncbi:MAG: hypothetical protein ACLVJ6_16510 [Merdibacter sp.]
MYWKATSRSRRPYWAEYGRSTRSSSTNRKKTGIPHGSCIAQRDIPIRRPRSMIDALAQGHTHGEVAVSAGTHRQTLSQVAVEGDGYFALVEGVEDPLTRLLLRTLYASGCQASSHQSERQTATASS